MSDQDILDAAFGAQQPQSAASSSPVLDLAFPKAASPTPVVAPQRMPDGSPYTGQPWQDAILRAYRPGGSDTPVGAAIGHIAEGTIGSIQGGYRGLTDLATGRGLNQAAGDVRAAQAARAYKPTSPGGQLVVGAINSPANPMNWADMVGQKVGDLAADQNAPPWLSTALRVAPDAAAAVMGMRSGRAPETIEGELAGESEHPLAAAAAAETERLGNIKQAGLNAGLALPEGGAAAEHAAAAQTNRPIVNALGREELRLPENAPLTSQMLDAARKEYASPAYEEIRQYPDPIKLDSEYQAVVKDLNDDLPAKYKMPEGESMTGQQAVDLSKKLRYRANQYERQAEIGGSPDASDAARVHRDAAEAIEDAVQRHLDSNGQGKLASDWDDARVYTAKTYSVQNALDGAGNINPSKLKQQLLKNKPLSGNLETVANLAAEYPQAFKLTQQSAPPAPGIVRRATAAALPHITTAGGAAIGGVTGSPFLTGAGALGGRALGERAAERLLGQ